MSDQNVTLIGMSGAGKSSVGVLLAAAKKWRFLDIDRVLEEEYGRPLQEILDSLGEKAFLAVEARKIKDLEKVRETVLAPGGSIVYSPDAMAVLTSISTIVYLEADPRALESRIDTGTRGIVGLSSRSFQELFREREHLYRKYAQLTVVVEQKTPSEVCRDIMSFMTSETVI